jgi:uncharacterized SAM-dependent methyltransferase
MTDLAVSKKKQQPKINDLIFKELIKRGYSLEGNTRVWNIADSKLWYLTPEQAQAYLDVENSSEYQQDATNIEYSLLGDNVSEILDKIGPGPINVVDLGCGDGKKAAFLVKKMKGRKIRYCPIDISGYMVEKASKTFSNLDIEEIIAFQYNISDFENLENLTPLLRMGEFKKNLFLLLGYTLGNFEVNELLYEIRTAMKDNDVLVVVSGIGNKKWEEWAASKKSDKKMDNFFGMIPCQIGLKRDEIEFGARFKNSRVEYYYTILNDRRIIFQDKSVGFSKGDQIIVAVSYKHDKHDLKTYLNMHFNDVLVKTSADSSTAMAICKK